MMVKRGMLKAFRDSIEGDRYKEKLKGLRANLKMTKSKRLILERTVKCNIIGT